MNYRHAYHAGNPADVIKHAVLAFVLSHMVQKDKPLRVIDTHAGLGRYDLTADALADASKIPDDHLCVAEAFVRFAQEQGFAFWEGN